jgi:hypothetical protein
MSAMFRGYRRSLWDAVDWMDDRWDGSPLGTSPHAPWAGRPRRRGRGLLTVIGIVIALVAADRFFSRPFRRRSTFATIVYALVAIALGRAATSAWRRRQPFGS